MSIVKINYHIPIKIAIQDMMPGQVGITADGRLYIRSHKSATCLNDIGRTYTANADVIHEEVTIIPEGTEIVLKV